MSTVDQRNAAVGEARRARSHFVSHAMVVTVFTLLSRMTGLVRDAVLAAAFGVGAVSDAFLAGFLVPNLFRRLFGEGALSAAFIPHYTQLLKNDPLVAKRFASVCLTLLVVGLSGLTLVGEWVMWAVLKNAELSADSSLTIRLAMIMLPYMPLICVVALIGGILQVHGRFGSPAAVPVILNLVMIGFTWWAVWGMNGSGDEQAMRGATYIVAVGVIVAGVLQVGWQGVGLLRLTGLTFDFAGTGGALASTLRMMLPMVLGLAVFQINAFLDTLIALGLSPKDGVEAKLQLFGWVTDYPIQTGAVAALQWSQRLYQFPLGVFGIAIATAIFPALAHAVTEGSEDAGERFRTILRHGLRLTFFIGLPASVGLVLLREPIVRMVYERGEFGAEDSARVARILAGYATSIWAYSMMHVLTRAFYAMKDSATPLKISMAMVAINLGLNLTLIWPLGAAGLAWATATTAAGQVVCLLVAIRKKVVRPVDGYVLGGWGMTGVLTLVMAAVLLPAGMMLEHAQLSAWTHAAALLGLVAAGMMIVLGGAKLMGMEELKWLKRRRGAAEVSLP
jgi:putative peptidoglycan lipid II flippase